MLTGTALVALTVGFWPPAVGLFGAIGGVFLFFRGFRMLQYKCLILNTPFSKIRSASIGLVEVNGMPTGPQTINAPITGDPCYYYRARAWQWKESEKNSGWDLVVDESMFVPFFLEDSTGRVLISPQSADLDVHRSFKDDVSAASFRKGSPIPQSIQDFVLRRGIIPIDRIRLEEQIIQPGHPLFVFGTLGENPTLDSWAAQPHVSRSGVSLDVDSQGPLNLKMTYTISENGVVGGMIREVLGHLPGVDISPRRNPLVLPDRTLNPAGTLPVAVRQAMARTQPVDSGAGAGPGTTSVQVLSCQSAVASAVASPASGQNPIAPKPSGDFDSHAHVAIGKGERNEPFTISSNSQREVVESLAWQSTAFIWGGPVLTVACSYFLWVYFTWT